MELVNVYESDNHETCSKYNKMGLNRDGDTYANKDRKLRNKCVVLSTVCFSLMCIFLVAAIVVLHIKLTAEREVQATHMLQSSSRDQKEKDLLQNSFSSLSQKKLELETRVKDLTAEKDQLQSNFSSLSQKKLELETKVNDLTAEKSQLQRDFNSLNEKKLELERRVTSLSEELKKEASKRGHFIKYMLLCGSGWFFVSTELKSWSDSRQYCRDHGADLIIIKSEEKQVSLCECLLMNERNHTYSLVWIGLSDSENEGIMKWNTHVCAVALNTEIITVSMTSHLLSLYKAAEHQCLWLIIE
uniref:C-type lectin domain-containing protein n=1 Tax=Cyprinus carpio TaxID=7962 RepID=A0A8C2CAM0_CYPCA